MCVEEGESRPDTRRRGGVWHSVDRVVYKCFNCNYRTGWSPGKLPTRRMERLLLNFGADPNLLGRIRLDMLRTIEGRKRVAEASAIRRFEPDWPPIGDGFPGGAVPLDESSSERAETARRMITRRGLDGWTDWFVDSTDGMFRNRLILPFRHGGDIVGFSARALDGFRTKSKYLSKHPRHFLFNLDAQEKHETIIVTEGEYDALTVGGVSTGGNSISAEQAELLNRTGKRIVLLPDFDHTVRKAAATAVKFGWEASFPKWAAMHKDANEAAQSLGRAYVVKSALESAESSEAAIRVQAELIAQARDQ